MSAVLTINAVDCTDLIRLGADFQPPSFELHRGERGQLTMDVELSPTQYQELVLTGKDGVTPVFGGTIERISPIEHVLDADYCSRLLVIDFRRYFDFCFWTKTYTTSKTVKEILQDLITDKLGVYGITLAAGQIAGGTIVATADAPVSWTRVKVLDVIKGLCEDFNLVDTMSPTKVMELAAVGAAGAAPVELNDETTSRLTWENSTEPPANTVIGVCGANVTGATAVAQWTADGIATVFAIDGLNIPASEAWPSVVNIDGVDFPVGLPGDPATERIEWDYALDGGTLSFFGAYTLSLIPAAAVIRLRYWPQYPFEVRKTTGATPAIEVLIDFPDVEHWGPGNVKTQAALDALDQAVRIFAADVVEDGFSPNQLADIDVPERQAASTQAVVTDVHATLLTDLLWEYSLTLQEATVLQAAPLARLKRVLGTGGSGRIGGSLVSVTAPTAWWPTPLGGSDFASVPMAASPAYTDVLSYQPYYARQDFTAIVRVWLWSLTAGVTVTARLRNITDSTTEGTSSGVTGVARPSAPVTFNAALLAGKEYRLQVIGDTASEEVFGIGQMEAA